MSGDKLPVGGQPAIDAGGAPFVVIDDDSPGQLQDSTGKRIQPIGMVIETDDERPISPTLEVVAPTSPEPLSQRSWGPGVYAVASVAIFVAVYWAVSIGEWVEEQFYHHDGLGYAVLLVLVSVLFFVAWWLWSEISAWRRLVIADRLRTDLSETGQGEAAKERFLSALRYLGATMEGSQGSAVASFLKTADDNRTTDELLIILNHDVIYPMDAVAVSAIHRAVYDSFFLGLISPTPLTDGAAFVMRATAMIRGVAIAYGHRPGKLGLYRLIRRMIADVAMLSGVMIVMGRASSVVGHAIRQVTRAASGALKATGDPISGTVIGVGGDLIGDATDAVAEEIADAVAAATRMAQLGLLAIAVSRPITLSAERKKEVSYQLWEMVRTLRRTGRQGRALEAKAPASFGNP